jgi:hypothetical protein
MNREWRMRRRTQQVSDRMQCKRSTRGRRNPVRQAEARTR